MTMTEASADHARPFHTPPQVADVRGLATAYRRVGSGPVVVYLHGATVTGKWLPFHAALAGRVDLVAPEQPGFGDTPLPDWLRCMDDVVLHLDDLLAQLDVEELHLAGHGLGAWMAAAFAVTYPRRLRSLTLAAPMGLRVPERPVFDTFRMTPDEADEILLNGTSERFADELDQGDRVEATVRGYREITAAARVAWNPRYDVRFERLLARVTCPALVIAAGEDRIVGREHAERYAELLPAGRLETIAGAAHLLPVQEPLRLAELIASFVTDLEG
jgi:pimeloyl-ACP methyl ester carboxylesterase